MNKQNETAALCEWLVKNKIPLGEAKQFLKELRNQKARQYSTFSHNFSGKHIKIGVLGDTHFGNKWTDKAFLNDVMKKFKSEGVEAVYHTGDITDGPWQRHRNVLEQYAHGFDNQVNDFVNDFPDTGIPLFCIDGNHDGWYRRGDGGIVGEEIALRRKDITYLGADEALIDMGGLEMMLSHPDDGSAYAYSYKAQKFIEALVKMGESVPQIIVQGHYHKAFYMNTAGTHYICSATTCRQTPWMRGRKIAADIGAYMFDIYRNGSQLTRIDITFLPHNGNKHKPTIK